MTSLSRLAGACAALLLAAAAPATILVSDRFTGTIASGTDNLGLFFAKGTSLADATYELTLVHQVDGYSDDGHGGGDNRENDPSQYSAYSVKVNGKTFGDVGLNGSQRDVFGTYTGTEFQTDVETASGGPTIVVELPTALTDYLQPYVGPATLDGYVDITIGGVLTELNFKPDRAARLVTSVEATPAPEPATWAMLVAGFGLLGGALRRERRVALARSL